MEALICSNTITITTSYTISSKSSQESSAANAKRGDEGEMKKKNGIWDSNAYKFFLGKNSPKHENMLPKVTWSKRKLFHLLLFYIGIFFSLNT